MSLPDRVMEREAATAARGVDQEGSTARTESTRDATVRSGAQFSDDRRYRYALWREWESGPTVRSFVVIGLNPSTADESEDDPTIRRCIAFAKREGCGRLVMLNLFALRATDPRVMKAHPEPVGIDNDGVIWRRTQPSLGDQPIVVAAWGVHGVHRDRDMRVRQFAPPLVCFGVTKDGHPRHPLYLRADAPLVPYPPPERAPVPAVDPSRSTPDAVAVPSSPAPRGQEDEG
jgi:hypothetical protein